MSRPSQVARMVRTCIQTRIPFYLAGPVGAGKSQVVKQVADELGIGFTDVRLSQMDPTDIKGFPSPDAKHGVMRWLPADFLPTKGAGLLFLDELVSAPQAVQAAAYQLVLDRKVGSYELPPGWAVGAAGNRAIDRSIVHRMPAALANRLVHVDYDVDLEDWVAYAMAAGVSADNVAFLRFRSKLLHDFNAEANPMAFPTPRAWFTVDKIMKAGASQADEYALIQGTVGQAAAAEHAAFMRVIKNLPTPDEIKVAPDTTKVPKEPATLYALTTSLAMASDKATFPRFLQYVERMEKEWQVIYIRDCLKRENSVKLSKEFTKWSIANADVVL
jgi:hypothetical protein